MRLQEYMITFVKKIDFYFIDNQSFTPPQLSHIHAN